ncbi:MAG TPA: GntR family transcriptional regulator [Pseudonocardia sp.]|jgi:DNA-binding GntR family transcriptional regulator|nr:GntR family transcriptional regulator [Pseudonocardia sp.]
MAVPADPFTAPDGMPLTRAGAVAQRLRELITAGELPLGSRLRQNEIAERLGVSSTPVREAFLLLAREGLVHQDTHRGAVVFSPTAADVEENYELRIALECLAVELAAKQIGPRQLDELDALLVRMNEAPRTDVDLHTKVLNRQFHTMIYRAADRPKLLEMIDTLRDTATIYQALLIQPTVSKDYLDAVRAEHQELIAALRARAPKRAARAVRAHIEHNYAETMARLRADQADPT